MKPVQPLLSIKNLSAGAADGSKKNILAGFSLEVARGTVHAIMGPNGSGKSTLGRVLAGDHSYKVTKGSATLASKTLLGLSPEARAKAGLFLAFQYPVEIPGVRVFDFLQAIVNERRALTKRQPLDAIDALKQITAAATKLGIKKEMLQRNVNVGFSGGEKKRLEMLQMQLLQPKVTVLDETDSGLDIDALKAVGKGINAMRGASRALILITHYQRLLDLVKPDFVHVMQAGRIVKSGGPEIATELEAKGYQK